MRAIQLADQDYERVTLLARAWEVSEGEVVRRLLDDFVKPGTSATPESQQAPADTLSIYAHYEGSRIEGIYDKATKRVVITSGALKGRSYKSPSGAAIAVVRAHNPHVHPNRNGWSFWFLADNGKALQTIRP